MCLNSVHARDATPAKQTEENMGTEQITRTREVDEFGNVSYVFRVGDEVIGCALKQGNGKYRAETPSGAWAPASSITQAEGIVSGWRAAALAARTEAPARVVGPAAQVRAGDLVEAAVASTAPRTLIRVRVDREPWGDERTTIVSDGRGVLAVFTDTVRVVPDDEAAPENPFLRRCAICGTPTSAERCPSPSL
uniref:hypothetical protein n=1 Tax=Nonomuraea sp. CA-251285 TaxID=3240002 RepID=UPI003F497F68